MSVMTQADPIQRPEIEAAQIRNEFREQEEEYGSCDHCSNHPAPVEYNVKISGWHPDPFDGKTADLCGNCMARLAAATDRADGEARTEILDSPMRDLADDSWVDIWVGYDGVEARR